jgi:hypothetical protein
MEGDLGLMNKGMALGVRTLSPTPLNPNYLTPPLISGTACELTCDLACQPQSVEANTAPWDKPHVGVV